MVSLVCIGRNLDKELNMDWLDLTLIDKLHARTGNRVVNDPLRTRPQTIVRVSLILPTHAPYIYKTLYKHIKTVN